jgi:hypothetical protein
MKLIFLDRKTLQYKDYAPVGKEYEINLDMVIIQRSVFKANKTNIQTAIGDIVIASNELFSYIGILESIEQKDDHSTIIKALDFREIFNLDIPVVSFTGDLIDYLYQVIHAHFKVNADSMQNLDYLTVQKDASVYGSLSFEADKIESISKLFELVSKTYGISFQTEVQYVRGRITGILFKIVHVNEGLVMKSNFSSILNIETNDSSSQVINKIIFYPRSDNEIYKDIKTYYLLTRGNITEDSLHLDRYHSVMAKSFIYADKEVDTLETKARSEMMTSKLDHYISFNLDLNNKVFKPFMNFHLGDYISFIHKHKTYDTVVTGILFKDTLKVSKITLGEYRVKLTEKIQLLSKVKTTTSSSVTITNTNLDGGEF